MRISDWSSDVCSSDLGDIGELQSVATASRGEVGDHVIALIAGQREAENVSAAAAGQGIVAVAAGQRVALIGAGEVVVAGGPGDAAARSEEHPSELQSLMRTSYAVFCLTKKQLQ